MKLVVQTKTFRASKFLYKFHIFWIFLYLRCQISNHVTNQTSEIGDHSIISEKDSEMSTIPQAVNIEERLEYLAKMEEEFSKRENLVISVANVENLQKPQSVKDWTMANAMVQPTHDGRLYVQVEIPDKFTPFYSFL